MPQVTINSANIDQFIWSAVFNPKNQTIKFDIADTTYSNISGQGELYVLGAAFSVVDQQGVVLAAPDWTAPQILPQDGQTEYTLDLSSVGIDFFFQTYKIIGYIKDGNGQIYQTTVVYPKICQPVGINQDGSVDGIFQITANCPDNILTVKEVTVLVYNNLTPESVVKAGTLTYPTGTISPVAFTGTPFTNNVIYTGEYRILCETVATYNIGNDIYVDVTYSTNNVFEITCSNKLQDIICCIIDIQREKTANCNNAKGERAAQLEAQVTIPFLVALSKEMSGQDASAEVAFIKKTLNCNCGNKSIIQNEFTPINPSVTNIVLTGIGGTSISTPTINGNTKTYPIQSNVYQVVKGDTGDNAFTITLDTNTANTVKYVITFNYTILAQTILNTIGGNSGLLTQLNSLVSITNFVIDLSNLNGGCIIDLSSTNYFLSLKVPSASSTLVNVVINGVTHTPGSPLIVNNPDAIETYLNGLGLGTFSASFSSGTTGSYINILTTGNGNTVTSATFNIGVPFTVPFQMTNKSLIAFLQAVVDYICSLSALEILLGQTQVITYIDYNGDTVIVNLTPSNTQADFNTAITNILNAIQQLNLIVQNGLTRTLGIIELGGNLIKNTTIGLSDYVLNIAYDAGNGNATTRLINLFTRSQGTSGSDKVTFFFQSFDENTFIGTTVADRAGTSYYAKSYITGQTDANETSIFGSHYPVTSNVLNPPPPLDPDHSVYVKASQEGTGATGLLSLYGKTQAHTGDSSNFDTLLRVKRMTTVQRDAIDVSLLTLGGIIIFNTTAVKFQGWNGVAWNNFD